MGGDGSVGAVEWAGEQLRCNHCVFEKADGTQPPVEILVFEHNSARMDLTMTWRSSTHLDVGYGSKAQIDFQAVKAFGEIEISVRSLSDGATSPS